MSFRAELLAPMGWRMRRLGDAIPLLYGKALAARDRRDGHAAVYGSAGAVGVHDQALTPGPTVIVGRKGSAGKVHYAAGPCWPIDTAYYANTSDDVDVRYAFHLLSWLRLDQLDQSTAIPSLGRDRYNEIVAPFPEPDVQRRIVARIDELFSDLDDGEEELARARADLAIYRKALLKAAVTGELTAVWRATNPSTETGADLLDRILTGRNARWTADPRNRGKRYGEPAGPEPSLLTPLPQGWAWATLPQLGEFGRGKSKHRPRNDPRLFGGPYPFVQTGVVAASRGRITNFDQSYSELGLAQSKLWPRGTLCITIAANIARTGVLQFDACFPDSVVGLTCAEGIRPEYVELVIRTLQQGLEDDAPATAQKNINLDTLMRLPIALPSTDEQDAIIAAVADAEVAGDLLDDQSIDADAATLRQSVLAAAFRGELI